MEFWVQNRERERVFKKALKKRNKNRQLVGSWSDSSEFGQIWQLNCDLISLLGPLHQKVRLELFGTSELDCFERRDSLAKGIKRFVEKVPFD